MFNKLRTFFNNTIPNHQLNLATIDTKIAKKSKEIIKNDYRMLYEINLDDVTIIVESKSEDDDNDVFEKEFSVI